MKRLAIFSAILLFSLHGCNRAEVEKQVKENVVNIRVHTVEREEYKIPVRATGILATSKQMKLSFKSGGLIRQIYVREGNFVKEGDLLAKLDLSEIDAHVDQALTGFEKASRDLKRARNLYADSVVTLEQFQNAKSAYEIALSQKRIAEFNLLHSRIIAPSDGKIEKILVEANEMVGPGYPVLLFASTENEWVVKVALSDKDIVKLSPGDSAVITMDAFPGERMEAEVIELGAIADAVTGTYLAELRLVKTLPQFRTGYIGRADIYPASIESNLTVPLTALIDANDQFAYLYTYDNGKVEKQRVRLGMITNDAVFILEGIKEGDLVVTEGVNFLVKDSRVNLVTSIEPVNR